MFQQSSGLGGDFVSHVMAQQGEAAELVPFELLHLELVSHIVHGETFYFSTQIFVAEMIKLSRSIRSRRSWWRTRQRSNIET